MNRTLNRLITSRRLAIVVSMLAVSSVARSYTVLHAFALPDGAYPISPLLLVSNTLYGTTFLGGLGGGTVFKVNIDGSDFQNLHNFDQKPPLLNQSNGGIPFAGGLVISGTTLFGTTVGNSSGDNGTVFAMNIDGSGYTNLHSFSPTLGSGTNSDGAHPYATLLFAGSRLYGTTPFGGTSGAGTIFSLNSDGSDFVTLYNFNGQDGANPEGGLIIQSNVLYGTTVGGGNGNGTVFSINADGTAFKTIYAFSSSSTNLDGKSPWATLSISEGTLYGTAPYGGLYGWGTLFRVRTDGSDFTPLHSFIGGVVRNVADGRLSREVTRVNDKFYGVTGWGGYSDNGEIYSVKTDGAEFNAQYCFPISVDMRYYDPSGLYFRTTNTFGALPFGGVIASSNVLYGVTASGGPDGYGVVYSLSLEPLQPPEITASFTNGWVELIKLTWPVDIPGFPPIRLQNSADPSFQSYTYAPSPVGIVTNGQTISGVLPIPVYPQRFFRLVHQW